MLLAGGSGHNLPGCRFAWRQGQHLLPPRQGRWHPRHVHRWLFTYPCALPPALQPRPLLLTTAPAAARWDQVNKVCCQGKLQYSYACNLCSVR